MYVQYQRAGRDLWEQVQESTPLDKRQLPNPLPGGIGGDAGGFSLTGPITITITRQTRLPLPTPTIESISLTQTSLSTESTTSMQTNLPTSTSPPALPTIILSLTSPPIIPPSQTPTSLTTSPEPTLTNADDGTALQNNSATSAISGGAVAGIVISCVFLVGMVLFFVWRTQARKRRRKSRGIWTTSNTLKMPPPVSNKDYLDEKGTYQFSSAAMAEQRSMSPMRQSPKRVPVPKFYSEERPTSEPFDSGLTSPFISTSSPGTALSTRYGSTAQNPIKSPTPQMLSPFSARVISTFIPNLPDELRIELDEVVRVLAEYDDGWALCMNSAGEQGMVPLECLDRGDSGVSLTRRSTFASRSSAPVSLAYLSIPEVPALERRGSKRLSSLDPTAEPLVTYPNT